MDHSTTIGELAKALATAQPNIKAAIKASDNPFFKSKYADLAAVNEACIHALNAAGLSVVQGGERGDGETVSVSTMLLHSSGEWIESTFTMKPAKPDPQGIGSAITYARRYGLAAICGVTTEDDDGNAASGNKDGNGKQPAMPPIKKGATLNEATRAPGTDKKQPYEERLERALGSPNFTDGQRTVFRQKLKRAATVQECADICADVEKQADPPAEGKLI